MKNEQRSKEKINSDHNFHYFSKRQLSACWRPVETIPAGVHKMKYDTELNDDQKQAFDGKTLNDLIYEYATFITKDNKLIYPELKINQRIVLDSKLKSTSDKPPPKKIFSDIDLQTWYYNKVEEIDFFAFSLAYIFFHS
jgi:hypothetical protein